LPASFNPADRSKPSDLNRIRRIKPNRSESTARQELSSRLEVASNDNAQLRRERKRLDEKLAHVHG